VRSAQAPTSEVDGQVCALARSTMRFPTGTPEGTVRVRQRRHRRYRRQLGALSTSQTTPPMTATGNLRTGGKPRLSAMSTVDSGRGFRAILD